MPTKALPQSTRRPFDPKQALHVVLKSSQARGQLSMLHPQHCNNIRELLDRLKKRWNVRVSQELIRALKPG